MVLVDVERRSLGKTTLETVHDGLDADRVHTLGRTPVLIDRISHGVEVGQFEHARLTSTLYGLLYTFEVFSCGNIFLQICASYILRLRMHFVVGDPPI